MSTYRILLGDCRDVLAGMDGESVDAIVTDPPYGLRFMGKRWDYDVPSVELWAECLRVLKPGGHLLAFAGTRTQHRMAVRIEDAGFEIRDMIAWVYGSGFPKSLDVSKAIDKAAGVERKVVGSKTVSRDFTAGEGEDIAFRSGRPGQTEVPVTAAATPEAQRWQGWGTALKPALEPITVARKPLIGTVAANVLAHGTGALNIDGCRIGDNAGWAYPKGGGGSGWHGRDSLARNLEKPMAATKGRWPANLVLDEEAARVLDEQSGTLTSGKMRAGTKRSTDGGYMGDFPEIATLTDTPGDSGGASRFFYCAKASRSERDAGLEDREPTDVFGKYHAKLSDPRMAREQKRDPVHNHHPTVKPIALMRWLVRLVTPAGGLVLDPFAGSGTTGIAAVLEGREFIGIERDAEYAEIAERRIKHWLATKTMDLFSEAAP